MTKREFEKIGKTLLCSLPEGFTAKQDLVFIRPVRNLLRAICFERSIDPNSFYVWAFMQPLFAPNIGFTLGFRINQSRSFCSQDHDVKRKLLKSIREEALPWIMRIETLENLIDAIEQNQNPKNAHVQQTVAFCLVRIGKIAQACEKLQDLAKEMSGPNEYNMKIPWREEMADRALHLKSLLLKDPEAAQKHLDEWEAYTIKNLKLEKYI